MSEIEWTNPREDFCHRCGRPNPAWFSPEWATVMGGRGGILCPACYITQAEPATWVITRWTPTDDERAAFLAELLRQVSDLGDDAERVARCVLDAGFQRNHGDDR